MPAVVVGGSLNGLGIVRSLALGGVPVYVIETTRQSVATWSRHGRFIRVPSLEGDELVECAIRLARTLNCRPVLFLTSDESVVTVSDARDRLQAFYRISLPSQEVVSTLGDKAAFQCFAQRERFAIPRGAAVGSEADIQRIDELAPPLIVKPSDKRHVLRGMVERAVRAETIVDAHTAAARMLRHAPQLIIQEWVDGPDTDILFTLFSCDRDGRPLGLFHGRKLTCSPPEIGSTAMCVAAPEAADLLRTPTLEFIRRTGYRGLGSLEFKRDSRTGRLLIIEPTVGRTDWQEEIATLCGINLPLLTYWAALEHSVSASHGPKHRSIAWRASKEVRMIPGTLKSSTHVVDGLFRWLDPMPAVYYYGYERLVQRIWRRAFHWERRDSVRPRS